MDRGNGLGKLRAFGGWCMGIGAIVSPHSIACGEGKGEDKFCSALEEAVVLSIAWGFNKASP
jgi:hypothetical protein